MARFEITFDASSLRRGLRTTRRLLIEGARRGMRRAAEQLIRDSRADVPILTGRLRDSGHAVDVPERLQVQAAWDAAEAGFHYAETQHEDVLTHVDGVYAAQWASRAINRRGEFYLQTIAREAAAALQSGGGRR